jgi:hypothetical protein
MARRPWYVGHLRRGVSVIDARLQCELGRLDETLFVEEDLIPGCDEPTIFASTALNGTLVVRVTPSQMFLLGSGESRRRDL